MVAATSGIAAQVGVDIMKKGGNAIDAAVATALAMAVTWPAAGNLGGGGFMLIRMADGTSEAIDYRERAPLAASRDMYSTRTARSSKARRRTATKRSAFRAPWRD